MKFTILIFVSFFFSFGILHAQFLDDQQRKVLGKFGIKKIQKTILSDSINSDYLWVEQDVNLLGFNIREQTLGADGRYSTHKNTYLYDSLLVESQIEFGSNPTINKNSTRYTYTKYNKVETLSFYDGDRLQMLAKHKYSKDGQLISRIDQQFKNKNTNNYHGKKKTSYQYNAEGKLASVHLKDKTKGKTEIKKYKYIYKNDPYTVEKYLVSDHGEEDQIIDREVFDDQNRLKVAEHFFRRGNSVLDLANRKMEIKKGESQRKEYFYDERGLKILEIISALPDQKVSISYEYYNRY